MEIEFGTVNKTKAAAGLITATVNTNSPIWVAQSASFIIGKDSNPVTTDGTTVLKQDMIFGSSFSFLRPSQRVVD